MSYQGNPDSFWKQIQSNSQSEKQIYFLALSYCQLADQTILDFLEEIYFYVSERSPLIIVETMGNIAGIESEEFLLKILAMDVSKQIRIAVIRALGKSAGL